MASNLAEKKIAQSHPILLFDGVCNLCNGAVTFTLKRDRDEKFRFASLQSEYGQLLLKQFNLPLSDFDSFVLVEGDKVYTKSSAALRVAKGMDAAWPLLSIFIIVPKFIRDAVYSFVAKNRYRWFGKKEACMIPTPELKARFLG